MNKKVISFFVSVFLVFGFTLTSCNFLDVLNSHDHTYSSAYEYNETSHWHPSTCGHNVKSNEEEHTFTSVVTDPTYESGGYTTYTCSVCGYSYRGDETSQLEHNYSSSWSYDENSHWHACTDEGYEDLKKDSEEHYFESYFTAPTYESEGYTTYTCSTCGYSYRDEIIPPFTYTVIWRNWDGTILEEDYVLYGEVPTYDGEIPTRKDSIYTYKFVNWSPNVTEVVESTTYVAQFSRSKNYIDINSSDNLLLNLNDTFQLTAKFIDANTTEEIIGVSITWESSDNDSVSVNSNGLVTLKDKKGGLITASCEFNGFVFSKSINVNPPTDGLVFTLNSDNISYSLTGYNGTNEKIYIPSTYNELPITSIGNSAFRYNEFITFVFIPDTIVLIDDYAFYSCFSLANVCISEKSKLKQIGYSSFLACYLLEKIYLPNTLIEIEKFAFYDSGLQNVVIPNSVTIIGSEAFNVLTCIMIYSRCKSKPEGWEDNRIEYITPSYDKESKATVIWGYLGICDYTNNSKFAYAVAEDIDGVKYIVLTKYYGFEEEVTIPDFVSVDSNEIKVKILGAYLFKDHYEIEKMTLSNNVTEIGGRTFENCDSLSEIKLSSKLEKISCCAFKDCSSLTSITISNSVKIIGNNAFRGCRKIVIFCEATSLPSTWNYNWNNSSRPLVWGYLGYSNFTDDGLMYALCEDDNGKYITIVKLAENVYEMGVEEFVWPETIIIPETIEIDGKELPVKVIAQYAFNELGSQTTVYIPSSIVSIGDYAFGGYMDYVIYCENVSKSKDWPYFWNYTDKSVVWGYTGEHGVTNDGLVYAVSKDENGDKYITIIDYKGHLIELTIPEVIEVDDIDIPVSVISESAFKNCYSLTSVTIPDSVVSIGASAFNGCSSLISISIPSSVKIISRNTFMGCSSLNSVTIPDSVTTIYDSAFYACSSLTSIYIPNSVTYIGSLAFEGCFSMTIYCEVKSEPSEWDEIWNNSKVPVVWNISYDDYLEAIQE